MGLILSAHQPNFCPYAGIFEKIAQSDVCALLYHVQFPKNGYVNRFYYNEKWYTMRVNQSLKPIKDKKYLYPDEDWKRITDSLPKLKVFDDCIDTDLAVMNGSIIQKACEILKIDTLISYDGPTKLTGTDRLIELCLQCECDTYLSGVSGRNYLEMAKFEKANIKVIFQENPDKRALIELL